MFSKLFGRNKKKSEDSPPNKESASYVTFSAQFPPPEWTWYESEYSSPVKAQNGKSPNSTPNNIYTPGSGVSAKSTDKIKHRKQSDKHDKDHADVRKSHQRRRSGERKSNHRHSSYMMPGSDKTPSSHRLSYPGGTHAHDHESIYERVECDPNAANNLNTDIGYRLANSGKELGIPEDEEEANNQNDYIQETFIDHDISIRYEGRLPKKDTSYAVSRESGVNCVGIDHDSYVPMRHNQKSNNRHQRDTIQSGQTVTHVAEVHTHPVDGKDKKLQHCQPSKTKHRPSSAQDPSVAHVQDVVQSSKDSLPDEEHPLDVLVASSPDCSMSCSSKSSTSKATVIESGVVKSKPVKSVKSSTPKIENSVSKPVSRRKPRGMPKPQNYIVEDGVRMKQVYAHRYPEKMSESSDTKKSKAPKKV